MSFNKDQITLLRSLLLESQSNSNDKRKQSEQKVRDMREKEQVSSKIIYKENLNLHKY